ncbi:hypothetical protein SAMN04490188_1295 [Pseudomonas kilonensis]|uniref:Uncharacterized protein n=1 Tax=Pseudomonas kilonensis TaxID=132476 RepID=A0ABY0YPB1_9PSED|nr:hypothetical protein SAMN04490188_1295 [Pseudomonas kilonensis]
MRRRRMRCGGWRIFDLLRLNEKPADWISGFFIGCGFCVYIRCCGHGCLGFRSYSGSLLEEPGAGPAKSNQKRIAPPLGASLRLGMPSLRHCSVGPLRNACVRPSWLTGRPRSTSTARRPNSRPGSLGRTPVRSVGAKLARDGGGSVTWMLGCRPLREQARSHSGSVLGINFVFTGD